MASGYNLTVQLNLQGPKNVQSIVNNINKQLGGINATVNIKTNASAAKQLQNLANGAKNAATQATQASNAMEKFGKQAGLAVKRFGAFTAATAIFYGVTRATAQAVDKFIEYDRQLTRVAQVTNTAKTSLGDLDNTITQLSTGLGVSSSELAQVSVTLSQAGLTAKQTAQALQALALTDLAPTFTNLNQTVEGSIALMKQFSISTGQLEGALGSINAVAGQFAVEAGDIITAIQRTGGVFAAASNGVSQGTDALNEFIAVFTSVRATTRESAETIATGLRTIFTRVQREDTLEALKEFGIELTDLEGKFVGPYKAIELLSQGLRNLDPRDVKFSSLVEELGGFRQVGKVIPLIQQFSTAQNALNAAQAGAGSLAKDAAVGQQALAIQIAKVQQEFEALIRSIGQDQGMQDLLSLTLDVASAMITVADSVKQLIPLLTTLGAIKIFAGIPSLAKGFKAGLGGKGYATGGYVTGPGGIDKVQAKLTQGEYVIRKKAVQSLGKDKLEEINRTGEMPGYAKGGPIAAEGFASSAVRKKVVRPKGEPKDYQAGNLVNYNDQFQFSITEIPVDASPKIGNTMFEKRVAATLKGRWQGKNKAVDVVGSGGEPIEVRNRGELTDPATLGDKLARHYITDLKNSAILANTGKGNENLNLGNIKVAYNTGKLDEETKAGLGKSQSLAKLPKGAKQGGFDFTKKAKGGNIGPEEQNALLTSGEYVLSKEAAKRLGRNNLDSLNQADRQDLPRYHTGGAVGHIPRYNTGGGVGGAGLVLTSLAIQGLTSAISTSIEDASSEGAAIYGAVLSGAGSGLSSGLVIGQIASLIPGLGQFAGIIGGLTAVGLGVTKAFIGAENAAKQFAEKIAQQDIESALTKIETGFEKVAVEATKLEGLGDVIDGIAAATRNISANRDREINTGTQSLTNFLTENLLGGQPELSPQQINAGTTNEQIAAQRALVLELKGISAYFSTLTLFGNSDARAGENLRGEINEINKQRSVESAKEFKAVADSAVKIIESRLKDGIDLNDIINSDAFDKLAESLARSNPAVEALILSIQANTQISEQEKQARINRVIQERAQAEIIRQTAATRAQIEIDAAQGQGKEISTTLNRVFNNFEQVFNRTASVIEASFNRIQLNSSALTGDAKIGLGQDRVTAVLENPRAFSSAEFTDAVNSLKPLLGSQANLIGSLATAGRDLEGRIISSINTRMQENPDATGARLARLVGSDIRDIAGDLRLPPEIAETLINQITAGIEGLRTTGKDKADVDSSTVRESITGFGDTIDAISGSTSVLIQAQQSYRAALEQYTRVSNQIITTLETRNNLLNRSFSILERGALRLSQAFGQAETASSARAIQNREIGRQTGGLTNPVDIFRQLIKLNERRQDLQTRREGAEGPGALNEFQNFDDSLIQTNVQINQLEQALQSLAGSTSVADAALSEIAAQNQRRQQQAGFLENLVGSTPEQLRGLNQAYADMQRAMNGQISTIQTSTEAQRVYLETLRRTGSRGMAAEAAQGQLAQERSNVNSLVKELLPFLGDDDQANNLRADVLGTQLKSIGQLTPQFASVLQAIRNPEADPQQQEAIRLYREAVNEQSKANAILAELQEINARQLSENSGAAIAEAISSTVMQVRVVNASEIAQNILPPAQNRASGGIIYAAGGQEVFKPKGTDTVPAMLTPGEFVVNSKATAQNRGLLESINSGKASYYNLGGYVSNGASRVIETTATTSGALPDKKLWEDVAGPNTPATPIYTTRMHTAFNPETAGTKTTIDELLPQNYNGKVYNNVQTLERAVSNNFIGGNTPGSVPALRIERLGKFNTGTENDKGEGNENYIDFGVASRIAAGARQMQKYEDLKRAVDIQKSDVPQISINSGVDEETILQYLSRETALKTSAETSGVGRGAETTGDEKGYTPDRIMPYIGSIKKFQFKPLDADVYGLYSQLYPVQTANVSSYGTRNDYSPTELREYRNAFGPVKNKFNTEPNLPDIEEKPPTQLDPNNPFMYQDDGIYRGLYSAIGAGQGKDTVGPKVTPNTGYLYGKKYDIDGKGTGEVFKAAAINGLTKEGLISESSKLHQLAGETSDILRGGLNRDQDAIAFEKVIDEVFNAGRGKEISKDVSAYDGFKNFPEPFIASAAMSKYQGKEFEDDKGKPKKIQMKALPLSTKGQAGLPGQSKVLGVADEEALNNITLYKKMKKQKKERARENARISVLERDDFVKPGDRSLADNANNDRMWFRYNSVMRFLASNGTPDISGAARQNIVPRGTLGADELDSRANSLGDFISEKMGNDNQPNAIVKAVGRGYGEMLRALDSDLVKPFESRGGFINAKAAGLSFAQKHWFELYAGNLNLAQGINPRTVEEARKASGNGNLLAGKFGQYIDCVADPYKRYTSPTVRSTALGEIYKSLTDAGHYGQRRNPAGQPSANEARGFYSSLQGWYRGLAGNWPGQDRFASELDGKTIIEKAKAWKKLWPRPFSAPSMYGTASKAHGRLGFGVYGNLPNAIDIAGIEGLSFAQIYNPQNAQFFNKGGLVEVQKALDSNPPRGSNSRVASRKRNKRVSPITGKEVKMDNPLGAGLVAGGADAASSVLDVLGVIPGAFISALTAPGAVVEQTGIGDFIGDKVGDFIYPEVATKGVTPSRENLATDVMKGGLSAFTKPGSKIAEGLIGKENMTPDSYIAGASQEDYMANLFKTNPAAAMTMMGLDFISPDGTEFASAIKYGSFFSAAFPTVKKTVDKISSVSASRKALKVEYDDIVANVNKIKTARNKRKTSVFKSNPYTKEELADLETLERQQAILQNELYSPNPAARSDRDGVAKVISDRKAEKEALQAAKTKADPSTDVNKVATQPTTGRYQIPNDPNDVGRGAISSQQTPLTKKQQQQVDSKAKAAVSKNLSASSTSASDTTKTFSVEVLDRQTGAEKTLTIEASDSTAAAKKASQQGYYTTNTKQISGSKAPATPSQKIKPTVQAPDTDTAITSFDQLPDNFKSLSKTEKQAFINRFDPDIKAAYDYRINRNAAVGRSHQRLAEYARDNRISAKGQEITVEMISKNPKLYDKLRSEIGLSQEALQAEPVKGYFSTGGSPTVAMTPKGSDTVPAMLTPGEFVVNRKSAQKNMGLLQSINRSQGGVVPNKVADFMGSGNYGQTASAATNQAMPTDLPAVSDGGNQYGVNYTALSEMPLEVPLIQSRISKEMQQQLMLAQQQQNTTEQADPAGDDDAEQGDNFIMAERRRRGGRIPRPQYRAYGGLISADEATLLDSMNVNEFKLVDGVDLGSPEEVAMSLDNLSGNLKSAGANAAIIDYMRNAGFNAGLNYAGGNQNQNTPGFDQTGKENDPDYGLYYAQNKPDFVGGGTEAGGQVYVGKNEYGQAAESLLHHELGHAIQNFHGLPDNPDEQGQNMLDRSASSRNLADLASVQAFASRHPGTVEAGGGYNEQQLLGNKQGEIFATLLGAMTAGKSGRGNGGSPQALRDVIQAMGLQRGGKVNYLKDGGHLVDYQPKGTDTVPAMLTPGEFVVNAKSAAKNAGLLKAINKSSGGTVSSSGVNYLADGGEPTLEVTKKKVQSERKALSMFNTFKEIFDELARLGQQALQNIVTPAAPAPAPAAAPAAQPQPEVQGDCSCEAQFQSVVTAIDGQTSSLLPTIALTTSAVNTQGSNVITAVNAQGGNIIGAVNATATDLGVIGKLTETQAAIVTAINALATGQQQGGETGSNSTVLNVEAFTTQVTAFGEHVGTLSSSLSTLESSIGVINDGAQSLNTASKQIMTGAGRFQRAASSFTSQTDAFLNRLEGVKLDGTITVVGSISVEPMTVNIAGL